MEFKKKTPHPKSIIIFLLLCVGLLRSGLCFASGRGECYNAALAERVGALRATLGSPYLLASRSPGFSGLPPRCCLLDHDRSFHFKVLTCIFNILVKTEEYGSRRRSRLTYSSVLPKAGCAFTCLLLPPHQRAGAARALLMCQLR